MSTRWLAAFLEAEEPPHVVTFPLHAKIAKKTRNEPVTLHSGYFGNFGTPSRKVICDGTDWQAFFNERMDIAKHNGNVPHEKATLIAYESCISHWLNKNPPQHDDMNTCPQCHKTLDRCFLAVLTGNGGHLWLHDHCHVPWLLRRRKEAISVLVKCEIRNCDNLKNRERMQIDSTH